MAWENPTPPPQTGELDSGLLYGDQGPTPGYIYGYGSANPAQLTGSGDGWQVVAGKLYITDPSKPIPAYVQSLGLPRGDAQTMAADTAYGRKEDFAGQLGNYILPAATALTGIGIGTGFLGGGMAANGGLGATALGSYPLEGAASGGLGAATAGAGAAGYEGLSGLTGAEATAAGQAGIDATAAGGSMGAGAGAAGAGTALSRILNGMASNADWLSVLGTAGATGLSALSDLNKSNQLKDVADQYMGFGAPSRARYEASFAPGFSMASDPGYQDALDQSAKATLHGLSVNGNPGNSPNAWAASLSDLYGKTAYPALQQYRNQNANTGGIGQLTGAAPGATAAAIGAGSQAGTDIGTGLGNIFNPPQQNLSLADLLKAIGKTGGNIFGT